MNFLQRLGLLLLVWDGSLFVGCFIVSLINQTWTPMLVWLLFGFLVSAGINALVWLISGKIPSLEYLNRKKK
jgi:hypothetical protein